MAELGETLDLHVGGGDLVFPHHENEIAQSEGVTGKPFVRHWLHVKHLILEGEKMSKSTGNVVTVRQLLERGVEPAAIRHQLLSAHYRRELNFTAEDLEASGQAVQRLLDFQARLDGLEADPEASSGRMEALASGSMEQFREALENDLNSAEALAALFGLVRSVNAELDGGEPVGPADLASVRDTLASMDEVLGILEVARGGRVVDEERARWIEEKIGEREAARSNRDFEAADRIRDELALDGVILEDTADGTRWKLVHQPSVVG